MTDDGTPTARFHWLMAQLESLLPDPQPYDSGHTAEQYYLHAIQTIQSQLAQVEQERDEWHADASSHLRALCEKQAEVNGLEQQLTQVTQERDTLKAMVQKIRDGQNPVHILVEGLEMTITSRKLLADAQAEIARLKGEQP